MSEVIAQGPPTENGKGERKPREKKQRERKPIPEFEDPDAELKKAMASHGYKPDRGDLDYKVTGFQEKIDRDKKLQDDLTRKIDAAKVAQQAARQKGNQAMEETREELRKIKAIVIGLFAERKTIAGAIDEIKNNKADMDTAIKKQRALCGNFNTEDAIDDEIKALEVKMMHSSMSLQEEKAAMRKIKDLNDRRKEVRRLQEMNQKRGASATTGQSFEEMRESRREIDAKLDEHKLQEKELAAKLTALKEKYAPKDSGENSIGKMLDERKALKENVVKNILAIKKIRDDHSTLEDAWYDTDRLIKALKNQIKQKNAARRAEERAAAGESMEDDEDDEEGEKQMDYDVADRIVLCEQLVTYLQRFKPKVEKQEEVAEVSIEHAADIDLSQVKHKGHDSVVFDDDLGMEMFYNENPSSSKKNKKDKRKARKAAKSDITHPDSKQGLNIDLGTLKHFSSLAVSAPTTTADVDAAISALTAKAAYYQEHGKDGTTLKEIQKMERAARKGGAKGAATDEPTEKNSTKKKSTSSKQTGNSTKESNQAFVFIKPHAVTDAVKELVSKGLADKGIKILSEGTITSEEIDEKKLIDQHYYAIASKATILKPYELNVPQDKFEEQFGEEWQLALDMKKVYNAMDGCHKLGLSADEMDKQWGICKKAGKMIKFGGGFYCGLIELADKDPIYVFNGFFMSMRSKFTAPGLSIHYYVVEFDANDLSWEDFRGKVLGPTDPAEAPADSLRGLVMADWKALGLQEEPNVGDNGVHASASPFEGLAERLNWVGAKLEEDDFGKELLAAGISDKFITNGCVDPQVVINAADKKGSLFDAVEDLNRNECINKLKDLYALSPGDEETEAPAPAKAPAPEPEPEPELDLAAARAAAKANAEKYAASLTPEEAAAYGAKKQVAASGVCPDSDSDDEGQADFQVGGEDDACLLGDY